MMEFGINDEHVVLCTHSLMPISFRQVMQARCCISGSVSEEALITLMRDREKKIMQNIARFTFKGK